MARMKDVNEAADTQWDVKRIVLFLAVPAALALYAPVREYLYWTYRSPYYTHVVLIPLISAYLILRHRREIFPGSSHAFAPGGALTALGVLLLVAAAAAAPGWSRNDVYALVACSVVVLINGSFVLLFGTRAFRAARFPLLFLLFMIPLPLLAEQRVIEALQLGSANFVGLLFPLTGVPVLCEGTIFHLPGLSIDVAPQCSGIRSSLALLITAVLAGHMFLGSTWKRIVLALAVLPVTMFKNGIRIVTLSLLAIYMDRGFLESSLHRDGGIVFFVLALVIMGPILYLLRRGEKRPEA